MDEASQRRIFYSSSLFRANVECSVGFGLRLTAVEYNNVMNNQYVAMMCTGDNVRETRPTEADMIAAVGRFEIDAKQHTGTFTFQGKCLSPALASLALAASMRHGIMMRQERANDANGMS